MARRTTASLAAGSGTDGIVVEQCVQQYSCDDRAYRILLLSEYPFLWRKLAWFLWRKLETALR
jgi:hypothetical protein